MAELIDKGALVGFVEKKFDIKCITEHGQGYVDAMHDMKDVIIALMPTTTESEIRAKAIDEFAEKLCDAFSENHGEVTVDGIKFDVLTLDGATEITWDVAEQLKEE